MNSSQWKYMGLIALFGVIAASVFACLLYASSVIVNGVVPFTYSDALQKLGGFKLWYVVGAFWIGFSGASAFLLAVASEVVSHPGSTKIKLVVSSPGIAFLYSFVGGVIAGVFQLAQANSFAPVQALVMGVTWPSVISQYLSSDTRSPMETAQVLSKQVPSDESGELA